MYICGLQNYMIKFNIITIVMARTYPRGIYVTDEKLILATKQGGALAPSPPLSSYKSHRHYHHTKFIIIIIIQKSPSSPFKSNQNCNRRHQHHWKIGQVISQKLKSKMSVIAKKITTLTDVTILRIKRKSIVDEKGDVCCRGMATF